MKAQKKICEYCGDKIKGRKYKVRIGGGREKITTVDTGCFLLLKEKHYIA